MNDMVTTVMEYNSREDRRYSKNSLVTWLEKLTVPQKTIDKIINKEKDATFCLNCNNGECKIMFTKKDYDYEVNIFTKRA